MNKFRKSLIWFSLLLLLPGIGLLSSCGDNSNNKTENSQPGQEKTAAQNRSLRGIKPVSKSVKEAHQRRLAIVIGNSDYEKSKLKNPVHDAQSMARLLKRLDFEVDLIKDGRRRLMIEEINSFGRKLRQADVGLFYYAGHGVQVKGHNYLIPTDAVLDSEADVEFEAIDLGRILGKMEDSSCPLNIVILDACRDNPFARSFRSAAKGLALVDAPRGTLLAFATAPGSVAADGNGRNGIYTKHLLANIERTDLSIEEVFKQVRIGVVRDTDGRQTPWESSSLMGSFHFQPQSEKAVKITPPTKTASVTVAPQPAAAVKSTQPHSSKPVKKTVKPTRQQTASRPEPVPVPAAQVASISKPPATAVKPPRQSPEIRKYLRMLQSTSAKDQRYAAKKICRSYIHNRTLLDAVNRQLLRQYKTSTDRHHIDALSWFCNVLGRSKQSRYAPTLEKVANSSVNRKLKKYAAKNLRYLR
jgi:uncharacterized caspase-like protein